MKNFKLLMIVIFLFSILVSCNGKTNSGKETLYVYNWGIYLDKSVIEKFKDKYNCEVVYDEFDTNEEMYNIVASGARVYDVLCPTDYMIEKMIDQGMLYEYDITKLPNYKTIDQKILKIISSFDRNNSYVDLYTIKLSLID